MWPHQCKGFTTALADSELLLQLRLAVKSGNTLKQREYLWRAAEAYDRLGEFSEAEEQLKALQDMELTKEQYLETLCFLADIQVSCHNAHMKPSSPMTASCQSTADGTC